MVVKKLMTYGRYALAIFLVIYLLLVWMYFKDNTRQLTSSRLLLWFVIIPVIMFGFILFIRWRQKKSEAEKSESPQKVSKKIQSQPFNSYQLFIDSSVCLPEGSNWSEIIGNDDDLTVLSEELSDFDGLPILTKPIDSVITEQATLYDDERDNTTYSEDLAEKPDELTLRLWALIDNQLTSSDDALSALAQYFDRIMQQNIHEPDSALSIHPEWQQHYIASAKEDRSEETNLPVISLSMLSVYLSIPDLADATFLVEMVKQQLATYGIPEQLLAIHTIIADEDSNAADINSLGNGPDDNDSETYQPIQFIHEHLITLAKTSTPEICLFITVDSQINEQWLEANLYVDKAANLLPTEAGALLIFYNKAAKDLLGLEHKVSFSVTEIGDVLPDDVNHTDAETSKPPYINTRQHYLSNLQTIKQLLLDNSFVLLNRNDGTKKATDKSSVQAIEDKATMTKALNENSITLLSDINPIKQPYNLSLITTFIDKFIEQGALVNDHHLGHYMPLNSWLKPFLGLALLVSAAKNQQQESDIKLLITQHKHCCVLWLAESNEIN